MVLVDTSVWIHHLRRSDPVLVDLLDQSLVLVHPFVAGELSCGNLKDREVFLTALNTLPSPVIALHDEVTFLIEKRRLWGKGIGWMDAHILASALVTHCALWTVDRRLAELAQEIGIGYGG